MTHAEFVSWQLYYEESPFDDHHRFHRPAVLVSQSMAGGEMRDKFDFLSPPAEEKGDKNGYSEADLNTLAAFGVNFKS